MNTLILLIGSLGLEAVMVGGWLRWQQVLAKKQRDEEEELLTPYESKDNYSSSSAEPSQENGSRKSSKDPRLSGWEFKIVRANQDIFRDPAIFKRLCDEEAQSGWVLLEKLDDRRVRFKRPIALRDILHPEQLAIDPYRTHYGSGSRATVLLWGLAFLAAIVLPAYLGYALVSATLLNSKPKQAAPAIPSLTPALPPPVTPDPTPVAPAASPAPAPPAANPEPPPAVESPPESF
jgi:hypothetical protein